MKPQEENEATANVDRLGYRIFWECLAKKIGAPMSLRLEGFNGKSMDFRPIFAE
jgi:hypothetical protein